jgi:hypothetical protein
MCLLWSTKWVFISQETAFFIVTRRGNLNSYMELTGWALWWRRNVSPVRYELGFYIPKDDTLHSHRRENIKSYIQTTTSTAWAL